MMASRAPIFCPSINDAPHVNVAAFVTFCRTNHTAFGANLNFDENVWDVTDALRLKGRGKKRTRITFYRFENNSTISNNPMEEPFLSFAKAWIRYMHGLRPSKFIHSRMYALKAVGFALERHRKSGNITLSNDAILTTAAQYIRQHFAPSVAYRVGQRIEELAGFIRQNRLTKAPLHWTNFLPRPTDAQRVGIEFDKHRASKLPSEAALDALPKIFRLATKPRDVLVSSAAAILCSAPDRINELLLLPTDCETTGQYKGKQWYGLRWWPSKEAAPMVKWVCESMEDVVRDAIANIRCVTAPARAIARWYEENPRSLYLPKELKALRKQKWLSAPNIADLLGLSTGSVSLWLERHGIPVTNKCARFRDIEQTVLSMLPPGFPVLDPELNLKYADALFVVRQHEFCARLRTCQCMIEPISVDSVNQSLGAKRDSSSIFARLGFTEPDGTPIVVRSHQFRHYLNTIAQLGGMSEVDVAKWSGRLDVRQNATYNHASSKQALTSMREALGNKSLIFGPLGAVSKKLINRAEFASLKIPTAHTTGIGYCIHDYVMMPCQLNRDCICCDELVCLKGDCAKNETARQLLAEARLLLKRAEQTVQDGGYGTDRWIEHYRALVVRLEQLCAIFDDPGVPDGSWISFSGLTDNQRGKFLQAGKRLPSSIGE